MTTELIVGGAASVLGVAGAIVSQMVFNWMPKPRQPVDHEKIQEECKREREKNRKDFDDFKMDTVKTMAEMNSELRHIRDELKTGNEVFKEVRDELKRHGERLAKNEKD